MIVVGVDPGARDTGVTIVDTPHTAGTSRPATVLVLASLTVSTPKRPHLVNVPPVYLRDVCVAITDALSTYGAELIAVEGVTKPTGFAHGRKAMLDPSVLVATGVVFGAVLGRSWGVPLVVVRPGGNGHRAWATYPHEVRSAADERAAAATPFAPAGDGQRRHERSAFDVARHGPAALALARQLGDVYSYAG